MILTSVFPHVSSVTFQNLIIVNFLPNIFLIFTTIITEKNTLRLKSETQNKIQNKFHNKIQNKIQNKINFKHVEAVDKKG